jgi:hypothetical protein
VGIVVSVVTAFGVAIATGAGNDTWSRVKGLVGFHDPVPTTTPQPTTTSTTPPVTATTPPPPGPGPTTEDPAQVIATRIADCEHTHHLLRQNELRKSSQGYTELSCEWPAPNYADADGYTEIDVTAVPIPGGSEATGADVDRIVGPCATFRMSYEALNQGGGQHLPPFDVRPGNIVTPGGQPYVDQPQDFNGATLGMRLGFTPATDEVEVVRDSGAFLELLSCVN